MALISLHAMLVGTTSLSDVVIRRIMSPYVDDLSRIAPLSVRYVAGEAIKNLEGSVQSIPDVGGSNLDLKPLDPQTAPPIKEGAQAGRDAFSIGSGISPLTTSSNVDLVGKPMTHVVVYRLTSGEPTPLLRIGTTSNEFQDYVHRLVLDRQRYSDDFKVDVATSGEPIEPTSYARTSWIPYDTGSEQFVVMVSSHDRPPSSPNFGGPRANRFWINQDEAKSVDLVESNLLLDFEGPLSVGLWQEGLGRGGADILEILVYEEALGSQEVAEVLSALDARYDLTSLYLVSILRALSTMDASLKARMRLQAALEGIGALDASYGLLKVTEALLEGISSLDVGATYVRGLDIDLEGVSSLELDTARVQRSLQSLIEGSSTQEGTLHIARSLLSELLGSSSLGLDQARIKRALTSTLEGQGSLEIKLDGPVEHIIAALLQGEGTLEVVTSISYTLSTMLEGSGSLESVLSPLRGFVTALEGVSSTEVVASITYALESLLGTQGSLDVLTSLLRRIEAGLDSTSSLESLVTWLRGLEAELEGTASLDSILSSIRRGLDANLEGVALLEAVVAGTFGLDAELEGTSSLVSESKVGEASPRLESAIFQEVGSTWVKTYQDGLGSDWSSYEVPLKGVGIRSFFDPSSTDSNHIQHIVSYEPNTPQGKVWYQKLEKNSFLVEPEIVSTAAIGRVRNVDVIKYNGSIYAFWFEDVGTDPSGGGSETLRFMYSTRGGPSSWSVPVEIDQMTLPDADGTSGVGGTGGRPRIFTRVDPVSGELVVARSISSSSKGYTLSVLRYSGTTWVTEFSRTRNAISQGWLLGLSVDTLTGNSRPLIAERGEFTTWLYQINANGSATGLESSSTRTGYPVVGGAFEIGNTTYYVAHWTGEGRADFVEHIDGGGATYAEIPFDVAYPTLGSEPIKRGASLVEWATNSNLASNRAAILQFDGSTWDIKYVDTDTPYALTTLYRYITLLLDLVVALEGSGSLELALGVTRSLLASLEGTTSISGALALILGVETVLDGSGTLEAALKGRSRIEAGLYGSGSLEASILSGVYFENISLGGEGSLDFQGTEIISGTIPSPYAYVGGNFNDGFKAFDQDGSGATNIGSIANESVLHKVPGSYLYTWRPTGSGNSEIRCYDDGLNFVNSVEGPDVSYLEAGASDGQMGQMTLTTDGNGNVWLPTRVAPGVAPPTLQVWSPDLSTMITTFDIDNDAALNTHLDIVYDQHVDRVFVIFRYNTSGDLGVGIYDPGLPITEESRGYLGYYSYVVDVEVGPRSTSGPNETYLYLSRVTMLRVHRYEVGQGVSPTTENLGAGNIPGSGNIVVSSSLDGDTLWIAKRSSSTSQRMAISAYDVVTQTFDPTKYREGQISTLHARFRGCIQADPYGYLYSWYPRTSTTWQLRIWDDGGNIVHSSMVSHSNYSSNIVTESGTYGAFKSSWGGAIPIDGGPHVRYGVDTSLSGSGSLTLPTHIKYGVDTSLSGSGSLTLPTHVRRGVDTSLSGSGSLTLPEFEVVAGTPIPTSGLVAWYDANSDYMQATYSTGNTVTTWDDLSGNGYDVTSVSGTATYRGSYVEGPSAWDNTTFNASIPTFDAEDGVTIFVVGQLRRNTVTYNGNGSYARAEFHVGARVVRHVYSNSIYGGGGNSVDRTESYVHRSGSNNTFGGPEFYNSDKVLTVVGSGGTQDVRIDGTVAFSGTSASASTVGPNFGYTQERSASWTYGSASSVGDNRIYELIIYDRALTTQEIEDVEAYLATKYSL